MNSTAITTDTLRSQRVDAAKRVIDLVINGAKLTDAVKDSGLTLSNFHYWLGCERELSVAYAHAREIRADVLVEEAIEAADSDMDPAKARNKMNIRQWTASKWNKNYSDRLDLNITNIISADAALTAAAQRLRPVRDQRDITDVEILTPQAIEVHGASDKQSVVPSPAAQPDGEPDIFS